MFPVLAGRLHASGVCRLQDAVCSYYCRRHLNYRVVFGARTNEGSNPTPHPSLQRSAPPLQPRSNVLFVLCFHRVAQNHDCFACMRAPGITVATLGYSFLQFFYLLRRIVPPSISKVVVLNSLDPSLKSITEQYNVVWRLMPMLGHTAALFFFVWAFLRSGWVRRLWLASAITLLLSLSLRVVRSS